MNITKIKIFLFIAVILAVLCAGCGEKAALIDFSDYVILRSDFTSAEETAVSIALKKYFSEYKGLDLRLVTDWQSDSSTAPAKEIIVGKAERSEYDAFIGKLKSPDDCAFGVIGDKLIFHAPDTEGLYDIIGKFAEDFLAAEPAKKLSDGSVYEYTVSEKLVRTDGEEIVSELRDSIMWGVNAHNRDYMAYPEKYTEEYIRLAAGLGCKIYRINYNPTNGDMLRYTKNVARLCHENQMKVMLVLDYMGGDVEVVGDRMRYMASELKDDIDYFQIFNETDIWCSFNEDGTMYNVSDWTGMSKDYYNPERVAVCTEKMRASINAFRETAPDAKLVVNIGSRHYPMLDFYIEAGLEWDIIAYDIYDLNVWDHHAFMKSMEKRYPDYEFMVAECNFPANSREFTDEEQAEWLTAFLKTMDSYDSEKLLAVMIYELMDEPNFEKDGIRNGEAHFGIVATNPDLSPGEPKTAYRTVQKLLCGGECEIRKVFKANG